MQNFPFFHNLAILLGNYNFYDYLVSSYSVGNHTRDQQMLSLVPLQTALDYTQSYYHYKVCVSRMKEPWST